MKTIRAQTPGLVNKKNTVYSLTNVTDFCKYDDYLK